MGYQNSNYIEPSEQRLKEISIAKNGKGTKNDEEKKAKKKEKRQS